MSRRALKLSPNMVTIPLDANGQAVAPRPATGNFQRETRNGTEAKFVRFAAKPHDKLLWEQAWDAARARYGLIEGGHPSGKSGWRLVSATLDDDGFDNGSE